MDAVNNLRTGSILNGGVGSGKSRTGLYYYFKENGGSIVNGDYTPMSNPVDLYIITTAMKRNKGEWDEELLPYRISSKPELNYYNNKVVIDSWNNIKKYVDVKGAFFIFDECHVNGYGTWTKAFLKMAKNNDWIILSATPGDDWMQYMPIFIANGFYRNKTEFINEHVVYSPYITKYPKIERYTNTGRLLRLRNEILVDMDFKRLTVQHHEDVYCSYDILKYKQIMKTRWDPYREEPITQASGLCYVLRKVVNSDETRQVALLEILEKTPKAIIFYSFDYELDILLNLGYEYGTEIAQYNGHVHEPIPTGDRWVYLVNYFGCEGWNAITTDTIIFFSQTYSYKTMIQAAGRIDRLNTPFRDLYYYHLKSRSGIDLAISKALSEKRKFNETKWVKW
jgi:superfamily II DNA or RNA helicase